MSISEKLLMLTWICAGVSILFALFKIFYEESDKKFCKNFNSLETLIRWMSLDSFSMTYKDKQFTFNSELIKIDIEGLKYKTIPYYNYFNIYLNEELVCRVHKLEKGYCKYFYSAEFAPNIKDFEVKEIIEAMLKKAKKEYNKNWEKYNSHLSSKSLFKQLTFGNLCAILQVMK